VRKRPHVEDDLEIVRQRTLGAAAPLLMPEEEISLHAQTL
jgi:hypothetical protein